MSLEDRQDELSEANKSYAAEIEVGKRWERTKPLAKELVSLYPDESEDQARLGEIADYLKENPDDAFQLFSQVFDQYPKPSDEEGKANSSAIYQISHLVKKVIEGSKEK